MGAGGFKAAPRHGRTAERPSEWDEATPGRERGFLSIRPNPDHRTSQPAAPSPFELGQLGAAAGFPERVFRTGFQCGFQGLHALAPGRQPEASCCSMLVNLTQFYFGLEKKKCPANSSAARSPRSFCLLP